jgi:hypothetical protein
VAVVVCVCAGGGREKEEKSWNRHFCVFVSYFSPHPVRDLFSPFCSTEEKEEEEEKSGHIV